MSERKIITEYVYPPIPLRCCDWSAYFADVGPEGVVGWGSTEKAAIADLREQADEDDTPPQDSAETED